LIEKVVQIGTNSQVGSNQARIVKRLLKSNFLML